MTPSEAERYSKAHKKHASEQAPPYSTHNRYNDYGSLRQTTTYDQFGRRYIQYDVNDGRRPSHQHRYEDYNYQQPNGKRNENHEPIE